MSLVYKVCTKEEWDHAIINKFYMGLEIDIKDGFILLFTKKQLNATVSKHFVEKKFNYHKFYFQKKTRET